jgi:hypothetical protein
VSSKRSARVALLLLAAIFSTAAYFGPERNWDLFGYIGSAVEHKFDDITALHSYVFDTVHRAVRSEDWAQLTQRSAWREQAQANPQAYGSVLEFYRVKVLYVAAVRLLGHVMNIAYAPLFLGWLFGILSLLVVYGTLARLGLERFFLLAIPVVLGANLQWLCRLPTPDSMSAFFLLCGICAYVFTGRLQAYPLFALSVLARPDAILFAGALLVVQILRRDVTWPELAAAALLGMCYLLATRLGGHSGWWPHFYYTHVRYIDMTGFAEPVRWQTYSFAVAKQLALALMQHGWLHIYLALLAVYAALRLHGANRGDVWEAILLATVVAVAVRAIVFPHMTGRIMCATVLVAGIAVAAQLAALLPATPADRKAAA